MLHRNISLIAILLSFSISSHSAEELPNHKKEFNVAYRAYQEHADNKAWNEALPYAQEALRVGEIVFKSPNKNLAALHHNVVKAYKGLGKYETAKKKMELALKEYENVYGEKAAELVDPLFEMGDLHAKNFTMTKQDVYYDQAIDIVKAVYGENSYEYPYYISQAGVNILVMSHRSTAKLYIKKANKLMAELYGEESPEMAFPMLNLSKYYMFIKQKKKAIKYLDKVVAVLNTEKARSNPINITAHGILVQLYTDFNDDDKATEHCVAIGKLRSNLPDQKPYLIVKKRPRFPSVTSSVGARVVVSFDVDEAGFVINPKLVSNTGPDAFGKASIDAISRYRYAPAFKNGVAVSTLAMSQDFSYGYVGPGKF